MLEMIDSNKQNNQTLINVVKVSKIRKQENEVQKGNLFCLFSVFNIVWLFWNLNTISKKIRNLRYSVFSNISEKNLESGLVFELLLYLTDHFARYIAFHRVLVFFFSNTYVLYTIRKGFWWRLNRAFVCLSVHPLECQPYRSGSFYISGVVIYMIRRRIRNAVDL